jgi:hypothetical protein
MGKIIGDRHLIDALPGMDTEGKCTYISLENAFRAVPGRARH